MIATGTDVRPLECLLFMRDVKSRNYFEQMKERDTRTILDDTKLSMKSHSDRRNAIAATSLQQAEILRPSILNEGI